VTENRSDSIEKVGIVPDEKFEQVMSIAEE